MALTNKLTAIAEAIRSKTGGTEPLTLDQMVTEIEGISAGGSSEEWIGDGNTHIWITLPEGRTSPMLGVCGKGTVTVDWGDGTTPDVLTVNASYAAQWTPTHNYGKAGDYVITLTVEGTMRLYGPGSSSQDNGSYILRHSSSKDGRNTVYQNAVRKIEIGNDAEITDNAFCYCYGLESVAISEGVKSIGEDAFYECYGLKSVAIPESVTRINSGAFNKCYTLKSIVIPDSVMYLGESAFAYCDSLTSIVMPESVTNFGQSMFNSNGSLISIIIPKGVTALGGYVFNGCGGLRFCDFTKLTAVPTLTQTSTFANVSDDLEIRVPAALYDEWIAATNWTTLADKIVAV